MPAFTTGSSSESAAPPAAVSRPRCLELDMIRGMALFVMLSDHLVGNPWTVLTSRPLGIISGADVFFLASGMAAGLKYQTAYATGGMSKVWAGVVRSWVILLVTCAIVRTWSNLSGILYPYPILWALILLLAPAFARGRWKTVLALSFLAWLAAFVAPLPGPFHKFWFNPLSWQMLFCVGFAFGRREAIGSGPLPRNNTLLLLSAPIAIAFFLLRHSQADTEGWLFRGNPNIGPLRLLDFLVVAYLSYHLVRVPKWLARRFAMLGREGIWIFVWITVLVALWESWKLPSDSASLRLIAATGWLASLWLAVPVVRVTRSTLRRSRGKLESVTPVEPAEPDEAPV